MFHLHITIGKILKDKLLVWVSSKLKYVLCCLHFTVKELGVLHDKHLNRPTLDDNVEEEHAIEISTQEITQVRNISRRED